MKKSLKGITSDKHIKGYGERIARGEHRDCVVRSIASAFDVNYGEAHEICATKFGRKPKDGVYDTASTFKLLSKEGFRIGNQPFAPVANSLLQKEKGLKLTVREFVEKFPTGRYIVLVRGHAFALVNGVVIGNSEDASKLRSRVKDAIRVLSRYTPIQIEQDNECK